MREGVPEIVLIEWCREEGNLRKAKREEAVLCLWRMNHDRREFTEEVADVGAEVDCGSVFEIEVHEHGIRPVAIERWDSFIGLKRLKDLMSKLSQLLSQAMVLCLLWFDEKDFHAQPQSRSCAMLRLAEPNSRKRALVADFRVFLFSLK
jgi:hypothetical protein